ncbi:molybdopterin molybdotransferase MoeA [Chelatococcus reniformis]|uniref:Molybdopterin molybdenumtransferase n=1 Tax=Chelatococcus reniformis TaxID=1494448 RepID=A0A916UFX3_9HYPH|nr:gephyrin-like molybdotransferase Glp [Chelatococcus reniformis]GGC69536.1 molybdopterin molybdenumtransferase MoeA [Chelatococcus reniformis]
MKPMLSVDEALRRVLASAATPTDVEDVAITAAHGRTLARDLAARRTQPPFDSSAMDGYAVRAADCATPHAMLRLIGTSAAGHRFTGTVGPGEAVRIFTGAPVPAGADAVIIQENAEPPSPEGTVRFIAAAEPGRHIRRAGLDFAAGDVLLSAGSRLDFRRIGLAAAMGHPALPVRRRPRVALLATGDELVRPGEAAGEDQIVSSNSYAVAALAEAAGAEPLDLGIARDDRADLAAAVEQARAAAADVLVTLGGASVGDHDLVKDALADARMELDFWRIAMRPGKPLMHGRLGAMVVLALPGNPVSAIVCAALFLVPLLRALVGDPEAGDDRSIAVRLGADVGPNDVRQDYLRARLTASADLPIATPAAVQDSSLLGVLASAEALIVRPPGAPAARAGEVARAIPLMGCPAAGWR